MQIENNHDNWILEVSWVLPGQTLGPKRQPSENKSLEIYFAPPSSGTLFRRFLRRLVCSHRMFCVFRMIILLSRPIIVNIWMLGQDYKKTLIGFLENSDLCGGMLGVILESSQFASLQTVQMCTNNGKCVIPQSSYNIPQLSSSAENSTWTGARLEVQTDLFLIPSS